MDVVLGLTSMAATAVMIAAAFTPLLAVVIKNQAERHPAVTFIVGMLVVPIGANAVCIAGVYVALNAIKLIQPML